MFEKLFDFLFQILNDLKFWVIIPVYEKGVRLRLGINRGTLEPGLHWKLPFADEILTHMVKTTTINLMEQSIVTKDGRSIVVKGVIKYEVEDVEKLLLEVWDPIDAISDMAKGLIRSEFIDTNWVDCNNSSISSLITKKVKSEAERWGIKVLKVTLTDLGEIRSFRLFNSTFIQ